MRKIDNIFKISKLERKASKKLRIEEVFKYGKNYNKALTFLKTQQYLPYKNIQKIVSIQKNVKHPIGSLMFNEKNIPVGFVGTWFSNRIIKNKNNIFCNIHSWIVLKNYRLYSFFLISSLYNKNFNLVALTPVQSLKGLLLKIGFQKKRIIFKVFLDFSILGFHKSNYILIKNEKKIKNILNKDKIEIYNFYTDQIYNKFILYDYKKKKSIIIIGCLIKKKGFKIFNIFYVSNKSLFNNHKKKIIAVISKKIKTFIFSEYIFENEDDILSNKSVFSKNFKRDIYIKSKNKLSNFDLLNSDLII